MNTNLQDMLLIWATETVTAYKGFAQQLKDKPQSKYTAFYTQSDLTRLTDSPQLAILAINPNSTCSYADQVANPYWKLDVKAGMTAECFLQGNPDFPNRQGWRLWNRLSRMLELGGIEHLIASEECFAYANIVNFNSPHPQDIPTEVFNQCAEYSFKLIELLQPKFIICLGRAPFDALVNQSHSNVDEIIPGDVDRIVLGNSIVVRIPHTSKFYTKEEMEMVGKVLALLFHHPEYNGVQVRNVLTNEIKAFEDKRNRKSEKKGSCKKIELDSIPLDYELLDVTHQRYLFASFLELTVAVKQGFVGIRHLVRHGNYLRCSEPNEEQLRTILEEFGFDVEKTQANCAWLGKKSLRDFGESSNEVINHVQTELKQIEKLVSQLDWADV